MSLDDLKVPFDRKFIEQKPGANGRKDDFVNHAVVTNRLNLVLGLDWSYTIDRIIENEDGTHVKAVVGTLSVRDLENNITNRTETGSPDRASNYGDDLKNSISDFVKRAAMRYGVGIQLWHEVETVEGEKSGQEKVSTKTQEPALAPSASSVTDKGSTGALNAGNGKKEEGGPDGEAGPTLLDHLYKAYGNGNKVLMAARKLYADVSPPNSVAELTEERMQELLDRVGV